MECFYNILERDVRSMTSDDAFCVYIDFPFCESKCKYCVYNTITLKHNEEKRQEYVNALINQIRSCEYIFKAKTPDALYFGGGTPSLFTYDELRRIKESIANYDKIKSIKTEAHPVDLNRERIEFYAKEMGINVVSLGVQSLDYQSCVQQDRIWIDYHSLRSIVELLQSFNIYVNVDLVALFNGDEDKNWDIFETDLELATNVVLPDILTCVVNYNTQLDYAEQVFKLRTLLANKIGGMYSPANSIMLSTDMLDIKKYRNNDHWIATKSYWEYQRRTTRYIGSMPQIGRGIHQATLAFGGANKHQVYSYPTTANLVCYSRYSFATHRFEQTIKGPI